MKEEEILLDWRRKGSPVPPPHIYKQKTVKEYKEKFPNIQTLIETGTYLGAMVHAMRHQFQKIITIELSRELYNKAHHMFSPHPHVKVLHGNSGTLLPNILDSIAEPCIFWLDGHYSEGNTAKGATYTPIKQELKHILNHRIKNHVILIDDARAFNGYHDYPTIPEVKDMFIGNRPGWTFEVKDDIIRMHKA